jgi:hypothetical protein
MVIFGFNSVDFLKASHPSRLRSRTDDLFPFLVTSLFHRSSLASLHRIPALYSIEFSLSLFIDRLSSTELAIVNSPSHFEQPFLAGPQSLGVSLFSADFSHSP